jgi:hypothetical protein
MDRRSVRQNEGVEHWTPHGHEGAEECNGSNHAAYNQAYSGSPVDLGLGWPGECHRFRANLNQSGRLHFSVNKADASIFKN